MLNLFTFILEIKIMISRFYLFVERYTRISCKRLKVHAICITRDILKRTKLLLTETAEIKFIY